MAQKINNPELDKQILDLFHNKMSIRKIAKETNSSSTYITKVITQEGKPEKSNRFPQKEGYKWVAECKKTGDKIDDYLNKSGVLNRNVALLYPEYKIQPGYTRRKAEKQTGIFWYEEFYNIIEIVDTHFHQEKKKCPYCDWTTIDLENKSGMFTVHLSKNHNITTEKYIKEFPEDIVLFKTKVEKYNYDNETLANSKNNIECKICKQKFRKISNTHTVNVHGISLSEYRKKYIYTVSESSMGKIKEIYDKNLKFYPRTFTSKAQKSICDFINSLGISTKSNDKKLLKGVEIDILMSELKLGIEFNGLLYHSELFGKKKWDFHKNKTDLMNSAGYKLIHIFEDDWDYKQDIVKSKLMHICKKTPNKIHSRKCLIKLCTTQEKETFLVQNHLLGPDSSNVSIGAYYNDDLVAVMTFDNKRKMQVKQNDVDSYELKRFAIKNLHSIPGVANRMIKHFINSFKPTSIISFAEKTWTNGIEENLYSKNNFTKVADLRPDYKYFNRKEHKPIRLHKFQFGKQSLKKMFPNVFKDEKTEWEIMQECNYDRVWDCGKIKYELKLQ